MRALTIESHTGSRESEQRRIDARLVTLAAESAARLERVCADWSRERIDTLAFDVGLAKLRGELAPESLERLRVRYERHRVEFRARLHTRTAD
jgi:hypothetical protein